MCLHRLRCACGSQGQSQNDHKITSNHKIRATSNHSLSLSLQVRESSQEKHGLKIRLYHKPKTRQEKSTHEGGTYSKQDDFKFEFSRDEKRRREREEKEIEIEKEKRRDETRRDEKRREEKR